MREKLKTFVSLIITLYSPEIKIFTTVDPENGIITDPITTLKYLYAEDNPVVKADYNGRSTSSFLNINKMFSADVKSTFCTTACSMAGDLLDLAKHGAATACEFTYNLVTSAYKGATIVMNSISNFYDSVPWQAKVSITACGMALAIASGVGVGFVASTVIKSAFSLAAINAGTSIISQMLTRQSVDVNEVMQSAERGFLDGAFTAGIFLGAIGTAQIGGKVISHPAVREFVARKKSDFYNFLADESGEFNWSRVGKGGSKSQVPLLETDKYISGQTNDHHIIPKFRGKSKPYADFIAERGIDVDQYTITVSAGKEGMHMNSIHGKGNWNPLWMEWIDTHPNATAKDIFQFAGKMMDDFGLSGYEIHPFHKGGK